MHYSGAVYLPPSEARSLIVQCTLGCSHNKCAFCTMYKDKKFSINPVEQVLSDLDDAVDSDASAIVHRAQVAACEPAVRAERFVGCFRIAEVAHEHVRSARELFALHAGRYVAALLVHHAHCDPFEGAS